MAIKLLVVDDHPVARLGIKHITAGSDIEVAGEAASAEQAIAQVKQSLFDVILLDVRMPQSDGLRCLAEIRKLRPQLPVLMFSAYDSPTYVARAVALGANGYLTKDAPGEVLLSSIRTVATGGNVWSREDMRRVTGPVVHPDADFDMEVSLTAREMEVLKQLAFGLTNKEIAQALGISYETVKEHVQHVLRKLNVADRTQAAVWAVRKGLA